MVSEIKQTITPEITLNQEYISIKIHSIIFNQKNVTLKFSYIPR